jgi:predicted nucleic acid-binding protein
LVAQLREVLRAGHLANASEPIAGVADDGAFLDSLPWGSAGQPVVVDANWLRNDLLRFFLRQEQTIMLTAANSGLLRLYCARHVLDEVDEHHATWALAKDLPAADVLHSWRQNYLPLLRRVDPPIGLLTADEQARIDVLHVRDPDDVPSATLALLLQAPLVSGDKRLTQAVYGSGAAVRRRPICWSSSAWPATWSS